MGSDVAPTPKKPPAPRTVARKRSVGWHVWWSLPIVPIAFFFMFTVLAQSGYNDFTKTYSFIEALEMAWAVPLSRMTTRPVFYLLPFVLIVHVLGVMALRRRMSTRRFYVLAAARLVLATGLPLTFLSLLMAVLVIPEMLTGTTGETYSDGFPIAGAVGLWTIYQLVILARDALNRVPIIDECVACRYPRIGLAAGALCPECGKEPEAVA